MATVAIQRNHFALLAVTLLMSSTVAQLFVSGTPSSFLMKKVSSSRDRFTTDFLTIILDRYTREINNEPPLVHLVIEAAFATRDHLGDAIVERYSKIGITLRTILIDRYNETSIRALDSTVDRYAKYSKYQHVIAIFESAEAVEPNYWRIAHKELWNSGAHFAILISNFSVDRLIADRLLRNFWALDCPNVVIACTEQLVLSSSSSGENVTIGRIYSYDPFAILPRTNRKNARDGFSAYGETTTYDIRSEDSLLFPEKLKDLRGGIIETSLYPHGPHASLNPITGRLEDARGLDVEVLRYVARRLNFTIRLKTGKADAASHVVRLPNGMTVGPIGDILTGKSEYLANGQFLDILHRYNGSLDSVYPHWRSRSVVIVRREPSLPILARWSSRSARNEGPEDTGGVYLVVLAVGLVLGGMIVYLRLLKKRTGGETLLALALLLVFQRLPKIGRLTSERIFCIACVCGSFIACTVYQGNLVNDLTSPPIFDDIDTLQELVERVESLRLMVRPYERRILRSRAAVTDGMNNFTVMRRLYERANVQLNFSACLARLEESRNVACSIDESYGKYALSRATNAGFYRRTIREIDTDYPDIGDDARYSNLLPPIHILDESLVDFWKTYFFRRGFPYLRAMDEAITSAVEFGLVDKWHRDDAGFDQPRDSNEPRSLGLSNMNYIFALLIVGYVIATLAFIGEITLARVGPFFQWKIECSRRIV